MLNWKKALSLIGFLLLALLLCSCGSKAATDPVVTAAPAPETVLLDGIEYEPGVDTLSLESAEAVDALVNNAGRFSALRDVTLAEPPSAAQLNALREALPGAALHYTVNAAGKALTSDAVSADLSSLPEKDVQAAAQALALLPDLQRVSLSLDLPVEAYVELKKAAPGARFDYAFDLFGQTVTEDTESLYYENVEIGNLGVIQFLRVLPCLDKLTELTFEYCGISDWAMADLRDAFPDKKIVWRVVYGWGSSMSDAETIWAIGGFNDSQLYSLRYCTEVKYLDLGHNGIYSLDFVRYMPKLEVLIVENDYVSDLSALSECKTLEYLEVGETQVKDVSPLAGCTGLEHLNIGGLPGVTDISPLYGLPKLKRLYGLCDVNVPAEQVEYIKSIMPDTEIDFDYYPQGAVNGSHWRYDENGIVPRYQLLHDQMGYYW